MPFDIKLQQKYMRILYVFLSFHLGYLLRSSLSKNVLVCVMVFGFIFFNCSCFVCEEQATCGNSITLSKANDFAKNKKMINKNNIKIE